MGSDMTMPDGIPALPADAAVFLDFDGTLVEIAPKPDQVVVGTTERRLLSDLDARLGGAIAVVSGRAIADLDHLLAPLTLSAAGLHGLERRLGGGSIKRMVAAPWMGRVAADIEAFARAHPGTLVENKGLSVAVHYRAVPEAATAVRQFVDACAAALGDAAVVQLGKMVVELRPAGSDKGSAIESFMTLAPFRDRRPVFLGDDLTDEHGFAAVNRLGGLSIRVGMPVETLARWALPSVAAAQAWLAQNLSPAG